MKASDLMLGDWTLCDGVPRKVSVLIEGQDARCGEPIELTTEILELNGFEVGEGEFDMYGDGPIYFKELGFESGTNCPWRIELEEDEYTPDWEEYYLSGRHFFHVRFRCVEESIDKVVSDVHKFQQLLRTAGLKDEANNFKVT